MRSLLLVTLALLALSVTGCSGQTVGVVQHNTSYQANPLAVAQCGPSSGDNACYYDLGFRVHPNGAWSYMPVRGPIFAFPSRVFVSDTVGPLRPGTTYDYEFCGLPRQFGPPRQSSLYCVGSDGKPVRGNTPSPSSFTSAPAPNPQWSGDFSTGTLSQYDPVDGHVNDFAVTTSPVPFGFTHSLWTTLERGNASIVSGEDGERALTILWPDHNTSEAKEGQTTWYRDMMYFPGGFQGTRNTDWNWLFELHNFPNSPGDAQLAMGVFNDTSDGGPRNGERLSTEIMGGGDSGHPVMDQDPARADPSHFKKGFIRGPSLLTGHWYDVVFEITWDYHYSGFGRVKEWIDGSLIGTYVGPTLFWFGSPTNGPGQAYLDTGYYRPTDSQAGYSQPQETVIHAGTMLGPSQASIGEAGLPNP